MAAENLYVWLLRAVAVFLLVLAVLYWMRLIGIQEGADWRFDTMAEHWRFAAAVLAAALPVAALGLWGRFSWGVAIWMPCVSLEFAMYGVLDELYGTAPIRLAIHALALLAFAVFQILFWQIARRQRQRRAAGIGH